MKYLTMEGVSTKIKDKTILKNISCNFPKSKISVIIGRSGAGKSTLLKTITRFWKFSGNIFYKGSNLQNIPVDLLRKDIGYVGQIPIAFKGTVRENVIFPRKHHGMEYNDNLILNFINTVGLDSSLQYQNANTLSVGQKQRLHLARTLSNEPTTILLDEPASALDVISKSKFEKMILDLKSSNPELTVIIVTHDLDQARNIGDHLVLIEDGKLLLEEDAKTFFSKSLTGDTNDKDGDMLENLINKLAGGKY
jgi:ABC-type phosphate transport system ATPase subunit